MNTTPATGLTDIELYLRATAVPTEYPLRLRIVDYWAGRADSTHLSTHQRETASEDITEDVLLTPWTVTHRNGYRASKELETITHNRIVDPLQIEKAALQARIPLLENAANKAAETAKNDSQAEAEPRNPKAPANSASTRSRLLNVAPTKRRAATRHLRHQLRLPRPRTKRPSSVWP
ncbi:hypothetical protein NHF46_11655 [Arthrobacter alpinus]|nr:hypothetical protein [Arthrobacter alpinus]